MKRLTTTYVLEGATCLKKKNRLINLSGNESHLIELFICILSKCRRAAIRVDYE